MLRTISVFEHGTLRAGTDLTQHELEALARFNDAHEQRYFSVGYRSVSFRQFVGYLQVGDLGIEVLPKADKKAESNALRWRAMLHEMLRVGLGIDLLATESARQSLKQPSLVELVVANLAPKVERLVREGLARGYREEEANGPTCRGKLVFTEQVRRNHTRQDRCFVRYSVYDRDIAPNQLLRAGLDVAAQAPISGPLRARVAARLLDFEQVRRIAAHPNMFDRVRLTRPTERYRDALLLSRMLVENLSPALKTGKVAVFAFLFDMNVLWERYVGVLFQRACRGNVRAVLQKSGTFFVQHDRRRRTIRADIALVDRSDDRTLAVLDTKWKLTDTGGPDDDHLKQMFAYNEMFGAPRAILLHPAVGIARPTERGTFWQREHCCEAVELAIDSVGATRSAAVSSQIREIIERVGKHSGTE